jgi:hypothetical protein
MQIMLQASSTRRWWSSARCAVAYSESLELVEPGEGALDDPAHLSQPGAMRDTETGDHWLDAAFPQQATVLVEVVSPSAYRHRGLRWGRPRRPRIGGTAVRRGKSWVTSCRWPPVSLMASGVP